MDAWKRRMPPGMVLKSFPDATNLSDPEGRATIASYKNARGSYGDDSVPGVPLQQFIDYGEAFQKQFAPDLAEKDLVHLSPIAGGGFRARFDDGEVVEAKRVVLAVGVHPFRHVPHVLSHLPHWMVSHSGDVQDLAQFDGKRVAVVGRGASAIDTAVLLHERGVQVSLVARSNTLKFNDRPTAKRTWWRELARPNSGLGLGWPLWLCSHAPVLFHALPAVARRHIVQNTLGPLGGYPMKARLEGKLPIHLGCEVEQALPHGDGVELRLKRNGGGRAIIEVDRVIAATGYRTDFSRLPFLAPELARAIRLDQGAPVLNLDYETSARGLYVIGPAAAASFGPVARFVYGVAHPARRLSRRFAQTAAQTSRDPQVAPLSAVARSS